MIGLDKNKISQVCQKNGIHRLYLVGSSARLDNADESDVDFLVLFSKTSRALDQYFNAREDLEKITGRKVDLIEESAITNERFRNGIMRDRVLIYEA